MTVENTHNYLLDSGVVSHNCDAARYFAIYWTLSADKTDNSVHRKWRMDQWEDYDNASEDDKAFLKQKWGEPV